MDIQVLDIFSRNREEVKLELRPVTRVKIHVPGDLGGDMIGTMYPYQTAQLNFTQAS
jgi:hypothetical protein